MQPLSSDPADPSDPLSDSGRGAIVALVRVAELYDPSLAHRSALRALVVSRLADHLGIDAVTRSHAIATSALADIDLTVSRPEIPEAERDVGRAVFGGTLAGQLPGLGDVARALRHVGEHFDGSGGPEQLAGDAIPIAARLTAASDQLVGNPASGYMPTWSTCLDRLTTRSGTVLDPQMVDALHRIELDSLDSPLVPSATILDLLDRSVPDERVLDGSEAATNIATAVAAAASVDELLQLFASTASRTISAASVTVLRLTATALDDVPIASADDGELPSIEKVRLDELAEFSTLAELRAGVPLLRADIDVDTAVGERLLAAGVGSEVTVPIVLGGETWGVISAARRTDQPVFDNHDLSVLRHIAHQASIALGNTVRWAEIEDMALRDQLTGLGNRHVLYSVLDEIFTRDPIDRQDSAVIMCDVDGLKAINDTLGHQEGDRLLVDAATALQGAVRDADRTTLCRIGGDEFCVVIDGGALLTAHEVSDTIERLFERSAGSGPTRSISCGLAFVTTDVENRSQLLRAADENQYQTKRARKAARGEIIPAEAPRFGDRRAIRP
ncbi:MAG: diguanylate cyclase [Acidimicrobiales bacterium]